MKVLLEVHGLSAFLPKPYKDPKTLRVLIPDVREPVSRKIGDRTLEVCAHTPKLIFPKSAEEWSLNGEHVVFSGAGGDLAIEQNFLDKIADMEKIAPGAGVLDRLYLADPPMAPGPDNVRIVADMQLESGRVRIGDLTPEVALREDYGAPGGEPVELAAYVTIEIDVPDNELTIMTRKFGTRETTRAKVLRGSSYETIEVILSNACDREDDPERPDEDFIIYYDLSHDYLGPKPIPHQLPQTPGGGGVNAGATRPGSCIAGLFSTSA